MKQIIVFIILIFSSISLFSQDDDNPVSWSQELNKISDTEYELIIKGRFLKAGMYIPNSLRMAVPYQANSPMKSSA